MSDRFKGRKQKDVSDIDLLNAWCAWQGAEPNATEEELELARSVSNVISQAGMAANFRKERDALKAKLERAERAVGLMREAGVRLLRAKDEKDAHGDTPVYQALKCGTWTDLRGAIQQADAILKGETK